MFTVLSNTRNSNIFLIGALAIVAIALLTLAVVPAVSAPQPALAPAPRLSEAGSDYYQRHPGLKVSTNDALTASDYFVRHPELIALAGTPLDECFDVSIGELAACHSAIQTSVPVCESPVDCR